MINILIIIILLIILINLLSSSMNEFTILKKPKTIIISLTTIPPRFNHLKLTINSILKQTIKPDKIIINIPNKYNNFKMQELPKFKNKRVIINRNTKDYGPGTKLLGLNKLSYFKNLSDDDIIIIIDDDRKYDNKLIENMLNYHNKHKDKALTVSGWDVELLTKNKVKYSNKKQPRGIEFKTSGYIDILGGCNGFLLTKKIVPFNNKNIFKIKSDNPIYYVDDVFISAFLTMNKVDIYSIPNTFGEDAERGPNNTISELWSPERDEKNTKAIKYFRNNYNIWK